MKVLTSEIKNKLKLLKSILDSKAQITALQGILFQNNSLIAYNLETAVIAKLDIEADETFIIPPKAIDIIQTVTDDFIELQCKENCLYMQFGKSKTKHNTMSVLDYPNIPFCEEGSKYKITAFDFIEAIKKCMYAVSIDESNAIHTGALFDSKKGILNIVACDGKRLAMSKLDYKENFKFVIPKKTLNFISSIKANPQDEISITNSDKHIFFNLNEYSVISRTLTGEFVDFKKVVPKHDKTISVNKIKLIEILSRIMLMQDEAVKGIKPTRLEFKGQQLNIETIGTLAEYKDAIELAESLDSDLAIGINSRYMLDALKPFEDDEIEMALGDSVQPIVLQSENHMAMVLPVRLK